ncbi:DUF2817 domain-containing protein [Halomonas venusta]|uniref:phage tail-collar fiber domain-containing protein n=1 Tax=Vreelandella venusta TaxID=44935 RepID=UPI00295EB1B3|nr:phage tail protein [Halomonas venusta]MDW0357819.1 DUF2817 domain-containing protein [Halomonas venusta]
MAEIETSTAQFFSLITATGLEKLRPQGEGAGVPTVELAMMAVGDGAGNPVEPSEDMTSLVNEQWRGGISELEDDPDNPTFKVVEAAIPFSEGGWFVREIGIYDTDGDLFAIGNMPPEYKPAQHEGALRDLVIRFYIELSNASNVSLNINPSHVVATRAWVVNVAIPNALTMLDDAVERAEVARDIAQLAVGIYATEQAGIDATEADDYFWVALQNEEHLVALYKNEAGTADFYGTYPSGKAFELLRERVNHSIEIASMPRIGGVRADFHVSDAVPGARSQFNFTDLNGNKLAGFDERGRFQQRWAAEFHTTDNGVGAGYAQLDKDNRVISFTNSLGQAMPAWRADFHVSDIPYSVRYVYLSRDNVIVSGVDKTGKPIKGIKGGGLDPSSIPSESFGLDTPSPYWNRGILAKSISLDEMMTTDDYATFTRPHTKQYDFFDELMSRHPGQITKEKIGESTNGQDINVYTFDFTPGLYGSAVGFERSPPIEIIITGGLHGNEAHSQILVMVIAKGIADAWRDDSVYSKLRWQCIVRFVPCSNPDGIDAFERRNANNVDLNRNFPTDWESSNSFAGPGPASEIETQILMNLPTQYPNARITLDTHTTWGRDYYLWVIATNQMDYNLIEHYCRSMMYYQVAEIGDDESNPRLIYPTSGPTGTLVRHFGKAHEKAAFLHETTHGTNEQQNEIPNGNRTNFKRFGLSGILNLLDKVVDREINKLTSVENAQ